MRSRSAWLALTAVLAIELVLGLVLVITMIPTFPEAGPDQAALMPLWVSLLISMILACLWIAVTLVGAMRRQGSWVRGSAVTIHVLMFAAALGVFQGILGTPAVGALLLGLAVVGFASAILIGKPAEAAPQISEAG
ncbi:hypothetical protein U746_2354 [Mycolicibacterium mucogenicum 261Sha1.1M5]|uniref:hypothetical protein n=1 Tax=Leucobacter aridicollis TaxID=283878 RepID=UPI000EAE4FEA|nr:hypothetical protein [Leucobacter aridicollis]MBL3682885.1 hypothetical protein [Leucobacter aridicollis]RKQ85265.1 hypothetical protein U746_2354 [Mycolicibacterium mucogenicum 261Sha1.1M5]